MKSKVMTIANRLVSEGWNRVAAMIRAWTLVKLPLVETRVAGVTFGNRQKAIEHLAQYDQRDISIHLVRERHNPADSHAVAVWVVVAGKGGIPYRVIFRRLWRPL